MMDDLNFVLVYFTTLSRISCVHVYMYY